MPSLISVATIVLGTAPLHTLRPILFRLGQDGVLPRVHSRLLQALRGTSSEDSLEFLIPLLRLDSSTSPHASFRESIVRQLFGDDTLLRLRLKLAIADFCWVRPSFSVPSLLLSTLIEFTRPLAVQRSTSSLKNRGEYGEIARDLLGTISHRFLKILLQHINLVEHLLTRKLPTDTAQ